MSFSKIAFFVGLVFFFNQTPGFAINTSDVFWGAWGYAGQENVAGAGSAVELILDGVLGKGGRVASHKDEGAVAVVVAEQITEHGGYFCPYQFQCANGRKNHWTWSVYYQPIGFERSKCAWLCEKGYTGVGCTKQYFPIDNNVDVVSNLKSGIKVRNSGGGLTNYENNITGFKTWNYWWYAGQYDDHGEYDVVLGVIKYLENGVIASPVQLGCKWDNWKSIDSWVESATLATSTGQKLLCKEGYTPNETNTDCIHATADMLDSINPVFCSNYPEDKFNTSLHRLVKNDELGCWMYFCRDTSKAFAADGDVTNCVDCATSIRGGPSERDGTCVFCNQVGQYFDGKNCNTAKAYTSLELQYGKGKTKATAGALENHCWIYVSPEDYKICVEKGKDFNPTTDLKNAE